MMVYSMVKSKNELIRIIRQVIGEERADGFFTPVSYNGEMIEVPNFLFKDAPSVYPEIRISPFLEDNQEAHPIRIRGHNYENKKEFFTAKFQVDIYATNIVQVNDIYDAVKRRIGLFYDIDTVVYGYDKRFKQIGRHIYCNEEYKNFRFADVMVGDIHLKPVTRIEDLKINTYLANEDGMYINTCLPIQFLRMRSIINGLLLPDGETTYAKSVIKMRVANRIMLSELEKNDVERISFELEVFYGMDGIRNAGPLATNAIIK